MDETSDGLAELIERGGIYRGLRGTTPREVLAELVKALPAVLPIPANTLLEAVLEREALMSTGIGEGIALPHPRNPLVSSEAKQFSALAYLESPVNWNSLDGKPVETLLLIVSASAKTHLRVLSEISFFSREEEFRRLLRERASLEELLPFIRETEKNWRRKP
jgi:PTS system nitrogen regulatory IIA component